MDVSFVWVFTVVFCLNEAVPCLPRFLSRLLLRQTRQIMRHQNKPVTPACWKKSGSALRVRHYSLGTEEAYLGWIMRFVWFHGKRHTRDMGAAEVEAFLTDLAVKRKV